MWYIYYLYLCSFGSVYVINQIVLCVFMIFFVFDQAPDNELNPGQVTKDSLQLTV